MSDSRRFDAHDPKHGRVGDLCRLLGYASDRKGTPRSMHFLSSKVAKFRKQFVESTEGIELFPLDYQSPEAQLCASSFLVENPHLFKDSEEARAFSWPISPRHDQRLIENLAKMMCTQEYVYRRNVNYAESMRQKRAREENEDSPPPDESDNERSEVVELSPSPAPSLRAPQDARETITQEKVRENIEIHFEFIYPLNETEEGKSSSFLFNKSERWPKDAKRFAWRYFHEHDLYFARKANPDAVILFAESLKRHLNVECTEAEDVAIQRRCGRQISSRASMWRGYGFLEEIDGIPRKTTQFEAAWRDRHKWWIDLVHNGHPTGVVELETTLPSASANGVGKKRGHVHKRPVHDDLPSHDASTGPAAKRPRVSSFGRPLNGSHTASEKEHSFDTGHRRHENMSVEEEGFREARGASEGPMLTPVATRPQSSGRAARIGPEQSGNNPSQPSPSAKNSSSMNQAPISPQSCASSARSNATLDENLDMPPLLEKRSSPYALFGSSLNLPFNVDTALVKSKQMASLGKSLKPSLVYILPNATGFLDYDNPLPRDTWWACSISEFFNVVARRAGRPEDSLSCLTFIYNWGNREAFVVNRFGGDQYWDEIRERVKGTFLKARNSMKKRTTRFELWIECGDTTNLDEMEYEDDC